MAKKRKYLGEVNLLGLNEFGQAGLNPLFGVGIGGGVAAITSIAVSHTGQADRRELIGLLAGLGTAGVMFAMKGTRAAGIGAAIGAVFASGVSWIEKAVSRKSAGVGMPHLSYLGMPQVNYLNGAGLGLPMVSNQPPSHGTIPGVAGPSFAGSRLGDEDPVSLLGVPTAQSQKIALMGGPAVHGLSASYGATLLGGGRN